MIKTKQCLETIEQARLSTVRLSRDLIVLFSTLFLFIMHDTIPKWHFRHYYSHPLGYVGLG
jgi:hypothetical protein